MIKMTTDLPSWKVVSNRNRIICLADNLEREGVCGVTEARDRAARIRGELMNNSLLGLDFSSVIVVEGECHVATMPPIFLSAVPEINRGEYGD